MKSKAILALLFLLLALIRTAPAGTLVQFKTTLGNVVVELYDQDKPVTVRNFIRYVDAGQYSNMFMHRCVTGFVAQGGGFRVADPASTNALASVIPVTTFAPITNEFAVGPLYHNICGTIAMAKQGGNPDSATSQWFFNLADNSANLDNQNGGFTVFGRVIRGFDVLEAFNNRAYCSGLVNLDGGTFNSVPVTFLGCIWPQVNQLIYVDVQLLSARCRSGGGGGLDLCWPGVNGMTNLIEYADCPQAGVWQTLCSTNGTGEEMTLHIENTNANAQFYRIRIE